MTQVEERSAVRHAREGRQQVAVVGGGISGMCAALALQRAGYDVTVFEQAESLGGRFGVATLGERPVMMGGKNIGRRYTAFRGFVSELGGQSYEPFGINASRMKADAVLTIDSTRRRRTLQHISQMGSRQDLLRLGAMTGRIVADRRNGFLGSPYFAQLGRRFDHAPLASHFSADTASHLLRTMTVRMNGAEPDEVYLGNLGTNLSLLLDTYDQLRDGIQPALAAFEQRVRVRLNTRVSGLLIAHGQVEGVWADDGEGRRTEHHFDGVIIASPAHATADIVRERRPALAEQLGNVRYFPSTVALVEYDRPVFGPQVRALAMDEGPCANAGSYGMEDRHIVRYTFSGMNGRMSGEASPARLKEWIGETEERLIRYLGLGRAERLHSVIRHWPAAYSGYLPFHADFLSEVRRSAAALPGLELAGDYLWGVSIEACSRSGLEAATNLTRHLHRAAVAA